jgi:hypothetical protein
VPLTIPKEYARGLSCLTRLSDGEFSVFASALAAIPASLQHRKDITAFVKEKIGDGPLGDIDQLMRSLLSLYQARGLNETPPLGPFVEDLADAMKASSLPELDFDDASRSRFVRNITVLLNVDTLVFLAKANALQRDHERLFHAAKILTDLRPVFHAPTELPKDMIVEYTLKIVFHDGSRRHREIYMVMDERDLASLREAIGRAEQKAAGLKSLCASSNIAVLPSLTEV